MRLRLGFSLSFFLALTPAHAETLHIMGAGSLAGAFTDLIRAFPTAPDTVATPEFGPSGLLRQKIESGAEVDLFASADMEQARRLAVGHPERMVVHFTRNRLCAVARKSVALTSANVLDRLLDPAVRLAISTPGADALGDYTRDLFGRAEAVRAGARATLEGKAKQLFGGGAATPLPVPGKDAVAGIFLVDRADVAILYCSGAPAVNREVPDVASVSLPAELSVAPAYGMVLISAKPVMARFAAFVMSEAGQAVLKTNGFDPVSLVEPAKLPNGLLVEGAGQPSQVLSLEGIAKLPSITQRIGFTTGRGEQQNEWAGPLLWTVLMASGVIESTRPRDVAHLAVRVTGADGYAAVVSLAELAPEFAGQTIQLADRMNAAPLPSLRLIVPGDHVGGRSVRDVVRIDVF